MSKANRSSDETSNQSGDKSEKRQTLGAMIGQSLAEESQASAQRVIEEVGEVAENVRSYIAENPREVLGLLATGGLLAWAATRTKPGRMAFDAAAAAAIPVATKWIARNFAPAGR